MIAPQLVAVSFAVGSAVITASNLRLAAIGCAVIDNLGPSAVNVFSGGSPSGLILKTIGGGQRRTVFCGNSLQLTIALAVQPPNSDYVGNAATVNATFDDDFSLAAVPDLVRGNSRIPYNATSDTVPAIMLGMDKIRGVLLSGNDASQTVTVFDPQSPVSAFIGLTQPTSRDLVLEVNLDQIEIQNSPSLCMLSDSPFAEGQSNPGDGPFPIGATAIDQFVDEVVGTTTIYTVPAGKTLYVTSAWLAFIGAANAGSRIKLTTSSKIFAELPQTPSAIAPSFPVPKVVAASDKIILDGDGGVFHASSAGFVGYLL